MDPVYRFGPYRLDPVARRLSRDGVVIDVTAKMLDTLLALVRHCGQVVTREMLLREVWPDAVIEDNNLSVHISKLRSALGESAKNWRYIETVARMGYRFSSAVEYESPSWSTRPTGTIPWTDAAVLCCNLHNMGDVPIRESLSLD